MYIILIKSTKKKVEHGLKRTFFGKGISCVPPAEYQTRFFKFIKEKVFL